MLAVAGLPLILAALGASLLAAACLRLRGLVATLLAAYVALTANLALVTLVLSPTRAVARPPRPVPKGPLPPPPTPPGAAPARPPPPLAPTRATLRELAAS